jgi:hypothetical protein
MKLSSDTFYYSLAVTCALLFFTPVVADEGSVSQSIWEFTIEPKPMIYKSGNVTYGNRLFMLPTDDCGVQVHAWFTSYNKETLKNLEGQDIQMDVVILEGENSYSLMDEAYLEYVLDPSFGDLDLLFSIASFRLGKLNSAETFLNWEDMGATGFQMTAASDEVFDVPVESWDFSGLKPALQELLIWCKGNQA